MSKAQDVLELMQANKKKIDVSLLSDSSSPCVVSEWFSSGCVVLDKIMGGGFPIGRIVEIWGDPSSGKSLVGAQLCAMAQQLGALAGYVDTETAVSIPMMEELGVNVDELLYGSPDSIEHVFDFIEGAIEAKKKVDPDGVMIIVWDSVAATSTLSELEAEYGKATMGQHARLISQGLRKLVHQLAPNKVCFVILNQVRKKIGVMFGDDETTFGGLAVNFFASIRIKLELSTKLKITNSKGKKQIVGMNTRATVIKNKVARPFLEASLPIYFGHGIDEPMCSFYYLFDNGYLKSGASWYTFELNGEEHKFQKKAWRQFYDEHYDAIAELILQEDNYDPTTVEPDS